MEAGDLGVREKEDTMVKRLDSIVGSDQWGRKKKCGGGIKSRKIKRGILGLDQWGKKKKKKRAVMENIDDGAEEIVEKNIGREGMMEKRAIVGLDLWGRKKRVTTTFPRKIILGGADRCRYI